MAFNISEFTSNLAGDGARPNLFDVTIPVFDQKLSFTCKAAQLPGSTIGVIEVPYFGRSVKFAGNRTFPEWTVTVINDEDFVVRNALESWMSGINSHEGNFAENLWQSYTFDGDVNQYGKDGSLIKTYTFKNMFPIDVSAIDLDWSSNDMMEEFQITFAYQYWTSDSAST
jgi:hypothetical protein